MPGGSALGGIGMNYGESDTEHDEKEEVGVDDGGIESVTGETSRGYKSAKSKMTKGINKRRIRIRIRTRGLEKEKVRMNMMMRQTSRSMTVTVRSLIRMKKRRLLLLQLCVKFKGILLRVKGLSMPWTKKICSFLCSISTTVCMHERRNLKIY